MKSKAYRFGDTTEEVFNHFKLPRSKRRSLVAFIKSLGYSEKAICYSAGRSERELYRYIDDPEALCQEFIRVTKEHGNRWHIKPNKYGHFY